MLVMINSLALEIQAKEEKRNFIGSKKLGDRLCKYFDCLKYEVLRNL